MKKIYAGTSGWAYSSWKRGFYPPKLSHAEFLNFYATRLNSVEVNYTFRQFPTKELLKVWIAATPAAFKFAVKAHQSITHFKRLRGAAKPTKEFFASLKPLRESAKLGPVLFQLPPNFKCDVLLLKNFLARLPQDFRIAFEFRHDSWFNEDVYELLRRSHVALCRAESDKLVTPDVATTNFSYLRLRKDRYPAKVRKDLAKKARSLARKGDVFVYFKHEDTPDGALHAVSLLKAK
ncbi:MAG: DUF72 domain-containing protein [Candidatus Acidiferrales bacterium]|jgi:uncharacterized protein YecE (DUF72 family)